jgi:nanoRNase/pAp phosphatase (c-di-AMP/oligoRNAs hydrolase)
MSVTTSPKTSISSFLLRASSASFVFVLYLKAANHEFTQAEATCFFAGELGISSDPH